MALTHLLFQERKKDGTSRNSVRMSFLSLRLHAAILTCILASASFVTHMDVLMATGLLPLSLPKFDRVLLYRGFTEEQKMGFLLQDAKGPPEEPEPDESECEGYTEATQVGNTETSVN